MYTHGKAFIISYHIMSSTNMCMPWMCRFDSAPGGICLENEPLLRNGPHQCLAFLWPQRAAVNSDVETQIYQRSHFLNRASKTMHQSPAADSLSVFCNNGQEVSIGVSVVHKHGKSESLSKANLVFKTYCLQILQRERIREWRALEVTMSGGRSTKTERKYLDEHHPQVGSKCDSSYYKI